jgi:hypothetical protein
VRDSHRPEAEREVLPSDVAERLLARAAELDSAQRSNSEITRLREAAAEAGMLPGAFDAALAEFRAEERGRLAEPAGLRGRRIRALVLGALVSVAVVVGVRRLVPAHAPPGVEQAFALRCMAPRDAATLLVHSIADPAPVQLTISPEGAPNVLVVHTATRKQMDEVRAAVDQMDVVCGGRPVAQPPR